MAGAYNNLGNVYQAGGELGEAFEFYEKSIEIKRRLGDEHGLAKTMGNVAAVCAIQGEREKAREVLIAVLEAGGDFSNRTEAENLLREVNEAIAEKP